MFDYRKAALSVADRKLCDYAAKLTLTPGLVTIADVQQLRDVGFSDGQITIAAQVIGYFNYINRIADGLGVEPESWMKTDLSDWIERKGSGYLDLKS